MVVGVGACLARDPFSLELLGKCPLVGRVEQALRVAERDGRAGRELAPELDASLGEALEGHDLAYETALERVSASQNSPVYTNRFACVRPTTRGRSHVPPTSGG